jgi:hypothetical protein
MKSPTREIQSLVDPFMARHGFVSQSSLVWVRPHLDLKQVVRLDLEKAKGSTSKHFSVTFGFVDPELSSVLFDEEVVKYRDYDYGSSMALLKGADATYTFASDAELSKAVEAFTQDLDRLVLPFFETFSAREAIWKHLVETSKNGKPSLVRGPSTTDLLYLLEGMYGDRSAAIRQLNKRIGSAKRWDWLLSLVAVTRKSRESTEVRRMKRIAGFLESVERSTLSSAP